MSDILQVCVSREVDRESSQLSQGMVLRAGLCDGAWHHLALCIPTINVRRGGNLKVCQIIISSSQSQIKCHHRCLIINLLFTSHSCPFQLDLVIAVSIATVCFI